MTLNPQAAPRSSLRFAVGRAWVLGRRWDPSLTTYAPFYSHPAGANHAGSMTVAAARKTMGCGGRR